MFPGEVAGAGKTAALKAGDKVISTFPINETALKKRVYGEPRMNKVQRFVSDTNIYW